ncbi:MBL fold metallo-hydrolase [Massilia jejuensis]|uniref:MBL fold metallo-hydrolase n=1 Tax=Massilia jejuensis TaxID=648894 RepID=A0ABW0PQT7_9BURK
MPGHACCGKQIVFFDRQTAAPRRRRYHSPAGRHSSRTVLLLDHSYGGITFLVDPMLAPKERYPGFEGTVNSHLRNPLVGLPLPVEDIISADAVIVTHTHLGHWDEAAREALPKTIPLFAQDEDDAPAIRKDGFTDARVPGEDTGFRGVRLTAVTGQHGSEALMATLGSFLGKTAGVVFRRAGSKLVYVAGDTVWTPQVGAAIAAYRPDVIVLDTGYARIAGFDGSIMMGKEGLGRAYRAAPGATLAGIHMEAFNHMTQSRRDLLAHVAEHGMDAARVLVPDDGQAYRFQLFKLLERLPVPAASNTSIRVRTSAPELRPCRAQYALGDAGIDAHEVHEHPGDALPEDMAHGLRPVDKLRHALIAAVVAPVVSWLKVF